MENPHSPPCPPSLPKQPKSWKSSFTLKLLILSAVYLVLFIPLLMVRSQQGGRAERARDAEREVSSKWGGAQTVAAPVMQIGLVKVSTNKEGVCESFDTLSVLPETLSIEGRVEPEERSRGIYRIMLYRSKLTLSGEFAPPPLEKALRDGWKVVPDDCSLQIGLSDIKGIASFRMNFGGKDYGLIPGCRIGMPRERGGGDDPDSSSFSLSRRGADAYGPCRKAGVHCDVPLPPAGGGAAAFRAELELNGCRSLQFQPVGRDFRLSLGSPWPHPSFTGGFLPAKREVSGAGFRAEWRVGEANRGYPQHWLGDAYSLSAEDAMGVTLLGGAGPYQKFERAWKYASLVIVIVLASFLLFERAAGIWIHPVQYFFSGLSLVMFYLLLLAFGEHVGFAAGYSAAAAAAVLLETGYAFAIFSGRRAHALSLGGVTAFAYALIYVLVGMEDYALLAGSIVLFVLLAAIMKFTGRINREA